MVNDEKAPTGRPAGALGWAGLANLFYWIDRQNGSEAIGNSDPALCRCGFIHRYMRFNSFYDALNQRKAA